MKVIRFAAQPESGRNAARRIACGVTIAIDWTGLRQLTLCLISGVVDFVAFESVPQCIAANAKKLGRKHLIL